MPNPTFPPDYIAEVAAELDARGWHADDSGEDQCVDEACAAGAQIIAFQRAEIERLRSGNA